MPTRPIFWVYLITCAASGKSYVGITRFTPRRRLLRHFTRAEANKHRNGDCPALHAAMRKYGREGFEQSVLFAAFDWETAQEMERRFIADLGTKAPAGYNLTDGGEGVLGRQISEAERKRLGTLGCGRRWTPKQHALHLARCKGIPMSDEQKAKLRAIPKSPEGIAKMAAALRGRKLNPKHIEAMKIAGTGRQHTAATRAKMSAWQVGKKHSDETKARIAEKAKGRLATEAAREANRQAQLGKRMSEEALVRMRLAKAAKSKPVICKETRERYPSLSYAGKQLGIRPSHIRAVLQGKVRAAKGLTFEYAP